MKVADFLFNALIREQNPFVDLSNKGEDLQPGYTQIHQVPGIINHVFVPFGNGWFIFGWSITMKFQREIV
jgi:hypothetical protein